MATIPTKNEPLTAGHVGIVIDSGIEGRGPEASIRTYKTQGNSAGQSGKGTSSGNHV